MKFYDFVRTPFLSTETDHYIIVHSEKVPDKKRFAFLLDDLFLKKLLSKQGWNILTCLASTPKSSTDLATELSLSEQLVSYHIRKLLGYGLIGFESETIAIDSLKRPTAVVR